MTSRRVLPFILFVALLALPAQSQAQTSQLAGNGTVQYKLVHKFHTIVGVSKAMNLRGTVDASGLKLMARAQVGTFDSENTNRDAHMMEAVEGEKYPWVSVRAVQPSFRLPTSGTVKVTLDASVELHGVSVSHPIEVTIEAKDSAHFHASFTFNESLTAHKIERPSLLFVPVDDIITIVGQADVTSRS